MFKQLRKKTIGLNKILTMLIIAILLCFSMGIDRFKTPEKEVEKPVISQTVERIEPNLPASNFLEISSITTFNGVTVEYENNFMNGYNIDELTIFFSEGSLDDNILYDSVAIEGKGVVGEKFYTNTINDIIVQNSHITYYEYNSDNRIIKEITNNYEREYEYDSSGRLTYIKQGNKNIACYVYNGDQLQFYYDYENRLVYEYRYDNINGRVTNILTYLYENNLLFMQLDEDISTTPNIYNDGFIITESHQQYGGNSYVTKRTVGGKIYEYSYINDRIVKEKIVDTQNLQTYTIRYIYDNTLERLGFVFEDEVYYYKYDIFGNVENILNAEGEIVASYKYTPQGNFIAEGELTDINPYTFRASHNWIYDNVSNQYFIGADTIYDVNTLSFINKTHKHFTFDPINYSVINGQASTINELKRKEGLKKETYIAERVAEVVAYGLVYENIPSALNSEIYHTSTEFMLPRASVYTFPDETNESHYYGNQVYYVSEFGTKTSERYAETIELIDNQETDDFAFSFADELSLPISGELGVYGHFVYLDEYVLYTSTEYGLIEFIMLENEWNSYEQDLGNLYNFDTNKYTLFFGDTSQSEFIQVISNVLGSIDWELIQEQVNEALAELGIMSLDIENLEFNSYITDEEHYAEYAAQLANNHDISIVMGYDYDSLSEQMGDEPWIFVDGAPKTLSQIKAEDQKKLMAVVQIVGGSLLLPFFPGIGAMMIIGGAVSIASDLISPSIATAFRGLTSIMNGVSALATGVSIITMGPVGIVLGGLAIGAGIGTTAIGLNDINTAFMGENFLAQMLGMSEEEYMNLNIALNIASTVLNIASNLHQANYIAKINKRTPNVTESAKQAVKEKHGNSLETTKPAQGYELVDKDTGQLLKYGETTRGVKRYTQKYLNEMNAEMKFVAQGSKAEMHTWQHDKILKYFFEHNKTKPPYNKSFY